jgi:hypothetical protein
VSPSGPRKLVCLPHAKSEKTVVTITADAAARACPCNLLLGPEQAHTRCSTANHHHHDQYGPMYNSSSQLRPSTPPAPSLHERWRQGEVEARKRWRRPHPSQEEVEEARSEPSAIRTVIKNRSLPPPPDTHTRTLACIYIGYRRRAALIEDSHTTVTLDDADTHDINGLLVSNSEASSQLSATCVKYGSPSPRTSRSRHEGTQQALQRSSQHPRLWLNHAAADLHFSRLVYNI